MAVTLGELAVRFGLTLRGDPDRPIDHVGTLAGAGPRGLAFFSNPKLIDQLASANAGAIVLHPKMQEATLRGDYAEARRINDTLARLHRAMFLEPSPAPAKYALSLLGLCENELRLPLVPVQNQAVKDEIRTAMQEAGVL